MKLFKRDSETFTKKAKILAQTLVSISIENTQSLLTEAEKDKQIVVDESKAKEVFFEMLLFYIHLVDRFSFVRLDSEKRRIFMDNLLEEVLENLSRIQGIKNELFLAIFTETYNARQIEYGKYQKLIPENGEGAKDTLFWEFGKKIAGILGNERDPRLIMLVKVFVNYSLRMMDLQIIYKENEPMNTEMNLEVHFHQQDEASVYLESNAIGKDEIFGEILLFCCLR